MRDRNKQDDGNLNKKKNKMSEVITKAELRLISMLREIEDSLDFVMSASLIARKDRKTEELISFLEEFPESDAEDVMFFLVPGEEE